MKHFLLSVYVAGASSELHRARHWIRRLRTIPGVWVVFDWTADVEEKMLAGVFEKDLSEGERFTLAKTDIGAVEEAEVVWGLIPAKAASAGLWFELGIAHARHKIVVTSGAWERSIFTSVADRRFSLDDEAFIFISNFVEARRGVRARLEEESKGNHLNGSHHIVEDDSDGEADD